MKISFCTTSMNRLKHLQETLIQNLENNLNTPDLEVEFVVLNYNSQDDMHEWMTTDPRIVDAIQNRRIIYGGRCRW